MSLLDNASLLLTPNAYKEGKLYSVIPSNGNGDFTATRATTATRVNSEGLVDLVPYNLFTWSEMFTNAAWAKSALSITANTTTAPDGTLTADTLRIGVDASSVSHRLLQFNSASPTGTYTASYYLKKANQKWVQLIYVSDSVWGINSWANFDLENGVIGNIGSGAIATITDVGNGWYRCTLQGVSILNTGSTFCEVISTNNSNSGRYPFYQSLVAEDVCYIWGAQLVEGTSARDYLRTETRLNIPRVDYSLGGCPNILLEPQRTNLIQRSSEFDNATWVKLNATVTANAVISPSGIQDADRIQITNATSNYLDNASASLLTNGATYTVSVYARSFGATNQSFRIYGNGNKVSPTLTATPNWQRFEYTFTATSTTVGCGIGSPSITDIVAWGYQLEAGAYSTSFIPTTTASVTRNADSITRNNIFTNGLITAAGGTWFLELRGNVQRTREASTAGVPYLGDSNSAGLGNNFRILGFTASRYLIQKFVLGVATTIHTTTSTTSKIAIKWNGTTADVFENGVKVVSATSFTATNLDFLAFRTDQVMFNLNEMALFPTPLTDAQCLALTA